MHVCGYDVDAELKSIKQMAVVVLGDHGAVYIDMIGNLEEEGLRPGQIYQSETSCWEFS